MGDPRALTRVGKNRVAGEVVSSKTQSTPSEMPRSVWFFVISLYVVCVAACVLTRDFGFYFDDKIHVGALRVTFESGVPLPRTYHYPSFSYLVSLVAAL